MARKVIWSIRAADEKDEILKYWLWHNQSTSYPRKLNKLFHQTLKHLSKHPQLGRRTSFEGVRSKLVRDYYVFYKFSDKTLEVLAVWDGRRNPMDIPFKMLD